MDATTILDNAAILVARQDINRDFLLLQLNAARHNIATKYRIRRFLTSEVLPCLNGIVDATGLKQALAVEFIDTDKAVYSLSRLASYADKRTAFPDPTITGTPTSYFEDSTNILILPIPTGGMINIYGEFWPEDLDDSVSSGDIMTQDIPYALIYFTAAQYLSMLNDPGQNVQQYLQIAQNQLDNYMLLDRKQQLYGVGFSSDPFGNGGVV